MILISNLGADGCYKCYRIIWIKNKVYSYLQDIQSVSWFINHFQCKAKKFTKLQNLVYIESVEMVKVENTYLHTKVLQKSVSKSTQNFLCCKNNPQKAISPLLPER